jgi:hypothetical protein
MRRCLATVVLALLPTAAALAQNPDPRERTVRLHVDGQEIPGCVGFRIEFARTQTTTDDGRRIDRQFFPNDRRLVLTFTQKGLNRLMGWLNDATDGGTPAAKTVQITARDSEEETLARWELTGVTPQTFSAAGTGILLEVDGIVEFRFERMRLLEARAD